MKEYKLLVYNVLKGTHKWHTVWAVDVDSATRIAKFEIAKNMYLADCQFHFTIKQYINFLTIKELILVKR